MNDNNDLSWIFQGSKELSETARSAATVLQSQLTKPPGALGDLEQLAITLAAMQDKINPSLDKVQIVVFAADHGVAREGVSAFPQAVTAEMVMNFARGGAAINVAALQNHADLSIINLGTVVSTDEVAGVTNLNIGAGTANFVEQDAMSTEQLCQALAAGRDVADHCRANSMDLYIGGEMGIGNTTAAAAMASVLLELSPDMLAGPGTGLDAAGVSHKVAVIKSALDIHRGQLETPLDVLQKLGGFEIAALCASYIRCAQLGIPVLVDGFISGIAALCANRINPGVSDWFLYSHSSAEPGHRAILECLNAKPLLNLGMRLGEASGAAIALPILRMACALHNSMATFEQAQVSEKL